ncbi:MAG: hypothetical protein BGO67_07465 [Alphaproteobacteria bacterium 41-28]|nr:MAG: hypothetical protein BGO67_07465 [Alphaproteobacteria bacterium 41-28]
MAKEKRTLTRKDIINELVQKEKLSLQYSKSFLEATLELLIVSLIEQKVVKITSFGSFKVRQKSKRMGRNPKTGKEAVIVPRCTIIFKPSQYLRIIVAQQ